MTGPGRRPPDDDPPVRLVSVDASWGERYRRVGRELLGAWGDAFETPAGRLLEVHHVGSTAVIGLDAKPTLDVIARVAQWPLDPAARTDLGAIGFVDHGEHGLPGRRFFTRGGHAVHLHVVGPDSLPMLRRHLAFRDLLLSEPTARRAYARLKARLVANHRGDRSAYVQGKHDWIRAVEARAVAEAPARTGFGPIARAARVLAAARDAPVAGWSIGGGWALDLRIGQPTRVHDDVDVVVDRDHAASVLRACVAAGVVFRASAGSGPAPAMEPLRDAAALRDGSVYRLEGRDGDVLAPSPLNGADAARGEAVFWDLVLETRERGEWRLRGDAGVRRPLARAVVAARLPAEGGQPAGERVPTLAPEVVLLTKARLADSLERPEGDADLRRVATTLPPEARAWLRTALARAPRHRWADLLD